ncbi:hypothetical protein DDB_G0271010 [Dictyostelium discoideum AX4]|uniref:KxDL domain-containing protein n=1 Tax=Dictyostelium discoideum TaxID=44689 RepID=Q55CL7_DICDI|nr:hypothetical protein DDB_G0271010 [Dictyostelium discoideum AX4]EAL72855.1 hypothetical protein DDB_G0271010 [Dictyostelium discoideum AX4]|eukprot:XP_646464.1 hypothetical protein DDB_G0271010 [Dictyostelium discoideum AX4]
MNNENQINDNPIESNDSKPTPTPTPSKTITDQMIGLTNQNDFSNNIYFIITHSVYLPLTKTLFRLKKQYETNHMLSHFNEYSSQKYHQMSSDFEKHTKMLKEMKKDLDYIFKKTRNLQILLNEKFQIPGVTDQYNEEEDEDDDGDN